MEDFNLNLEYQKLEPKSRAWKSSAEALSIGNLNSNSKRGRLEIGSEHEKLELGLGIGKPELGLQVREARA